MTEQQTLALTDFLLARIVEDEAVARGATAGPWGYNPGKVWLDAPDMLAMYRGGVQTFTAEEFVSARTRTGDVSCVAVTGPEDDERSMADAAHIARHDPARVLAECEAKRRIVDLYESWKRQADSADPEFRPILGTQAITGHTALRVLASVYADHPDYREEWRT